MSYRVRLLIWGLAVAAFLVPHIRHAMAAPPSNSKLGIHLIEANTPGAVQIENAGPRVIKILDTLPPMLEAARIYKTATPDGIVVLRIFTTKAYTLAADPSASATDFFNTVLLPPLSALSPADRALIDFVEGPNECDSTPCWATIEDAQWLNTFWVRLAPLIAGAGFRPCAFSIPVGNPWGPTTNEKIDAIVPALRVCQQYNGAWSYHPYTLDTWSTTVSEQESTSLRYRRFYKRFAQYYPDLSSLPMILTEGGHDSRVPVNAGWQGHGTAEQFENWLKWWDGQIRQDPYILGSTLFQIGSPSGWPFFDLEPIAGWLADYLVSQSPMVLPCSPTSLSVSELCSVDAGRMELP